ncbi:MAG: hypothetical protein PVF70_13805 [Anaerolineales bacterium]
MMAPFVADAEGSDRVLDCWARLLAGKLYHRQKLPGNETKPMNALPWPPEMLKRSVM